VTSTRRRLVPVALVVVGLAVAYGAGTALHPATVGSAAVVTQQSTATVTSATRACPSPGTIGVTAASVAAVSDPGSAKRGSAVISRLAGDETGSSGVGPTVATLTTPGQLSLSRVPAAPKPSSRAAEGDSNSSGVTTTYGRGGVMVQASGALAQGLEVEQTSPDGLATAQCQGPGTSFWFLGPGANSAALIELYLMNTDNQPADAQVEALTDNGPLVGSSDTGIVVPPHGIVGQSLTKLLHSSHVIALHVSTSIGRVVAAVRESTGSPEGAWLPVAQAPSRTMVIPGLPASSGTRTLYLAVPGSTAASIRVTAVTERGSYRPTGGDGIQLPGNSVDTVPLPSMAGVAGALQVTSSVPVVAAVSLPGGVAGSPGAFSATAGALTEEGIAADNPAFGTGSADLVLSAPGQKAASVKIVTATTGVGFAGQAGTVVRVPAGHSVVTRIRPPDRKAGDFAVVVTPQPGSGPVYVGRVVYAPGGAVRTILPLASNLTWVQLPSAEQALDTASSRR
jgi:hypothetical protein